VKSFVFVFLIKSIVDGIHRRPPGVNSEPGWGHVGGRGKKYSRNGVRIGDCVLTDVGIEEYEMRIFEMNYGEIR